MLKSNTRQIGEGLQVRMIEPDVHRVYVEMAEGLIHQNVQSQAQVKGGGDGRVNVAQGRQSPNLFLALIVKLGAMDRIAGNLCEDGEKIDLLGDLSSRFNCNCQHSHWTCCGLNRNADRAKTRCYTVAVPFEKQCIALQFRR